MEPVEVICEVLVRGAESEFAITIFMDDVLDDGAGFGKGDGVGWVGVIFEDGRGAERVF